MRTRSSARLLVLAGIVAFTAACKELKTGARQEFSQRYTCPEDRVQVRRRADVTAYAVTHDSRPQPPDEVARDPARLDLWTRHQRANEARWNEQWKVYEARGCGHQVLQTCSHPGDPEGTNSTAYGLVVCVEGAYPPGARKPW